MLNRPQKKYNFDFLVLYIALSLGIHNIGITSYKSSLWTFPKFMIMQSEFQALNSSISHNLHYTSIMLLQVTTLQKHYLFLNHTIKMSFYNIYLQATKLVYFVSKT